MIVAPPWSLRASGYAALLAPRTSVGREPPGTGGSAIRFLGGVGLLLLLEYDRSGVGPYNEALYIPGYASARPSLPHDGSHHEIGKRKPRRGHSIAWIVVSTEDSRESGIANWGIPKVLGSVERTMRPTGAVFLVADPAGRPLLRVEFPRRSVTEGRRDGPWFPISSRILPHTLVQAAGSTVYETQVAATGRFRTAGRPRIVSCAPETADAASRVVLAGLRLSSVRLRFPPPTKY